MPFAVEETLTPIRAPNRSAAARDRQALKKLAEQEPSAEAPTALDREVIKEVPNLFQPRHDSIAFAPGRSEAHTGELAQALRQSGELDPVTVIAFGDAWYLVDGHHRLAAYTAVEWARPIPVRPLHSDRRGDARIDWAIEQSMAENKKSKLNISTTDKADAAWQAVAQGETRARLTSKRLTPSATEAWRPCGECAAS